MKQLLLVFVLMFAVHNFYGQSASLSGKVTDATTGETLPGVNIILTGTTFGAIADFDGNYVVADIPPGEYNVQFTYIGYEKTVFTAQKFSAGEKKKLEIALKSTVLTFDEADVIERQNH